MKYAPVDLSDYRYIAKLAKAYDLRATSIHGKTTIITEIVLSKIKHKLELLLDDA